MLAPRARLASLTLALPLAVAGCSDDGSDPTPSAPSTAASTATSTPTAPASTSAATDCTALPTQQVGDHVEGEVEFIGAAVPAGADGTDTGEVCSWTTDSGTASVTLTPAGQWWNAIPQASTDGAADDVDPDLMKALADEAEGLGSSPDPTETCAAFDRAVGEQARSTPNGLTAMTTEAEGTHSVTTCTSGHIVQVTLQGEATDADTALALSDEVHPPS